MSASAQSWKAAAAERDVAVAQVQPAKPTGFAREEWRPQLVSLIHQVFLHPSATRHRVLFVAVDDETDIGGFCERVATVLTDISEYSAGVVVTNEAPPVASKKPAQSSDLRFWRTCSSPLCDRVWRLPSWLFSSYGDTRQATVAEEMRASFDCLLFAARSSDCELPVLSRMCDSAVLVLCADRTRKQSAVYAQSQLARYGPPLLGAILTDRAFVLPERVRRWL